MNKKVSRQGVGILGKKCLGKEMGTGLKREEIKCVLLGQVY